MLKLGLTAKIGGIFLSYRVGIGYDVHRLEKGRKLIIGGVDIPFEKGLYGHSDADVLIHAIMDSLLGALKLGDIGKLFPDSDEKFKDISSCILLNEVGKIINKNNYEIVNIDSIIVAQAPKMSPFTEKMEENISSSLNINKDFVSVKATTEEWLGFTGEGRAISSKAICMVKKC